MFQRIITALIGIPIILTAINWGGPWLLALLALITLVASGELNTLWRKAGYEPLAEVVLLGGLILLLGSYIGWGQHVIILLTLYTLTRETFRGSSLKNGPPAIFSVLYTGGCLGYIAALRGEMGAGAVFLLLITIWCTDTTAYFYGTYRGKRPLCPQISPKKTWEGAGAATLVAAGLASLSGPVLVGIGPGQALSFGFVISITGQMGDLVESSLKRQAGVKDTGRLLPGHGGLLDRFDSLLFAAPMAYYLLHIWM